MPGKRKEIKERRGNEEVQQAAAFAMPGENSCHSVMDRISPSGGRTSRLG
jgi:hypothetical protein